MSDQVNTLPDLSTDQIITEILTRLPAKSICRFKSVSKHWNSTISHPHFIATYISRYSSSPSSSLLITDRVIQLGNSVPPTQFHLSNPISTFSISPTSLAAEPVTDPARTRYPACILQSSNGLFLFCLVINRDPHKEREKTFFSLRTSEEALFVCNPTTRECVPLPKPRRSINKRIHVAFTTRVSDPSSGVVDKFMVVEYRPVIGSKSAGLLCFSSDTGKWVDKSASYMLGMHLWRAEGAFEFKGRLFWVDVSTGLITWEDDPFEGLDKNSRAVCRFIPVPTGRAKAFNTPDLEKERCFDVGGGFIQFMEVFKDGNCVFKLWRLNNADECEWSLLYKVSRDHVKGYLDISNLMPVPCFVHPFNADIAFFETGDHIFSFNLSTRMVESCHSFDGHEFVIPFLLPAWPLSLPKRLYAAYAKEEGNEYFKRQEFLEAIKCYSKSIALSPSAVAYANRGMAYLKVCKFPEAVNDCTAALNLDSEYFKAHVRRAMARKELGNLQGSLEDVKYALKLIPENQEMKDLYDEIMCLLQKVNPFIDDTPPDMFTDQIITEILTHLPAKSIFRFKCVSKRWNSTISHPHFIRIYISRSPACSWIITDRDINLGNSSPTHFHLADPISTFSINPTALAAEPVTDPARDRYPACVLQSSNGLFLFTLVINRDPHKEREKDPSYFLACSTEEALFVGNPITREWVPLPKPRQPINTRIHVAFTTRVSDPSSGVVDKFMVVEYQPIIGSESATLMCFSSDTGKWVEKYANYMLGMHFWRAEGAFEFKGRLFWVDLSTGLITWEDDPFEGLDKNSRAVCRFIPLPTGRSKVFNTPGLEKERRFDAGGGFIQFLEVFKDGNCVFKLWRLNADECEWSLLYKVSRDHVKRYLDSSVWGSDLMPVPCFVHPFNADIAFFETGDHIFSFNLSTRMVESCHIFDGHEFVIPFVLPAWPLSLPPRLYAANAKEEGNECFKSQEFLEAIKCYSKSIALSPSAIAYANRAMAYLKVCRFSEAEDDCTAALNLDDEYLKAHVRRAMARKELGNLQGSMEDVKYALKLIPENQEIKDLYAGIMCLLQKAPPV